MGERDGAADDERLLGTGDMARLSRSTLRTVRFYESEGLLQPSQRTEAGRRLFPRRELERLELVLDLREAGLSLQDIKDLLAAKSGARLPVDAADALRGRLGEQLQAMQEKITRLRRLREELASMMTAVEECRTCQAEDFPRACESCELMKDEALPRAMRVLWG
ncbi:MAG: MerR family transcriptional regulator [Myxococcota bacterium]